MGKVAGTGPQPLTVAQRAKAARPRIRVDYLAAVGLFSPAIILAHDSFLVALLVPVVVAAAYAVGHAAGRADLTRQLLLDYERDRDRRDTPAA